MLKELKLRELERKRDTMRHRLQMAAMDALRAEINRKGSSVCFPPAPEMVVNMPGRRTWRSHGWQP